MRSVEEHVAHILEVVTPLPPYEQPLLEALGLPICENIDAAVDLPNFDNSAMDGYAVRAVDVEGASIESPVRLPVVGELAAGQTKSYALSPGQSLKIMTGAPIPTGCDAVVPVEWTDDGIAQVSITAAPVVGLHIRRRGEDIEQGQRVLEDGTSIGPRQAAILAATGRSRVMARPRPRVVVISTGSELREPGTPLGTDSIYDSNSFTIAAQARAADVIAYRVGIVSDDARELTDTLSDQLVRADLVVTSGGVSKGEYDIVKDVLSRLGTVEFTEVAMQPGKPQGFGTIGEDSTPIFTLPGNPVSSYVSFEVFVLPALRRMMGKLPYRRPLVRAICSESFSSPRGRRQFARASFEVTTRGASVVPVGGQASHVIGGLSRSNALIVVPEASDGVEAGETVDVMVLDRNFLTMTDELTHVDEQGAARMVDVGGKDVTARTATAAGRVVVSAEVVALLRSGSVSKGDALGVARVAGIMAAKRTPDLVPLCHPLPITSVSVDLSVVDDAVEISAEVTTVSRTGVEMEALTAVSVAALTVVDMVKAVDKGAVISDVRVLTKSGGRSGDWSRDPAGDVG